MNETSSITLAIADDHRMFIDGIISMLELNPKCKIIVTAGDGRELMNKILGKDLDIILLDIKMPKFDGIETLKLLKTHYPGIKVIMLSMHHDMNMIRKVLKLGADGYILKNTGKEELFTAIQEVYSGKRYFSADISQTVMESLMKDSQEDLEDTSQHIPLSKRERQILALIVEEYTSSEIANHLSISINTVETHRKNLLYKLQVKNTAGLVRYAFENGLISS